MNEKTGINHMVVETLSVKPSLQYAEFSLAKLKMDCNSQPPLFIDEGMIYGQRDSVAIQPSNHSQSTADGIYVHSNLFSFSLSLHSPVVQPERIKVSTKSYDVRADIWSLGISLVELVTGSSPYSLDRFNTEFALLSHIVDAEPPLPDKDKFSSEFYGFVAKWWVHIYSGRYIYTVGGNREFLKQGGFEGDILYKRQCMSVIYGSHRPTQ